MLVLKAMGIDLGGEDAGDVSKCIAAIVGLGRLYVICGRTRLRTVFSAATGFRVGDVRPASASGGSSKCTEAKQGPSV